MATIRGVGIVGAGVIFEDHVAAYQRLSHRVKMVGVAELNDQARDAATRNAFIPMATADYRKLLERDDIDLIDVCTPPGFHEQVVVDALRAGKYVVCEKPLAPNLAAADRIERAAQDYPGRLSVVYQLRYAPEMRRMIWLRDHGHLGKLVLGNCFRFGMPPGSLSKGWWGDWETAGGGVVMTQFIHHLDQLCYLFGQPLYVQAIMDTVALPIKSEDSCVAQIRFENGAIVSITASVAAQRSQFQLDVMGDQLSVHLPWALGSRDPAKLPPIVTALDAAIPPPPKPPRTSLPAKVVRKLGRMARLLPPPPNPLGELHAAYLTAVLDAVDRQQPLPLGPEKARASLELCAAIYAAGLSGETVHLPITPDNPVYAGVSPESYHNMATSQAAV